MFGMITRSNGLLAGVGDAVTAVVNVDSVVTVADVGDVIAAAEATAAALVTTGLAGAIIRLCDNVIVSAGRRIAWLSWLALIGGCNVGSAYSVGMVTVTTEPAAAAAEALGTSCNPCSHQNLSILEH